MSGATTDWHNPDSALALNVKARANAQHPREHDS
jgi:hypothetical protein